MRLPEPWRWVSHTVLSDLSMVDSSLQKYILQSNSKLGKLRLGGVITAELL